MYYPLNKKNVQSNLVYGVYISQFILYSWAFSLYSDCVSHRILSTNLLNQVFFFKESSHLIFQNIFRKIATPCWTVLCHLYTDDERLATRFWFKVWLLLHSYVYRWSCILFLFLNNGWGHRLSIIDTNVIHMTSSASPILNILCIMFAIIADFFLNNTVQPVIYVWGLAFEECGKHLNDRIPSLRGKVWAIKQV